MSHDNLQDEGLWSRIAAMIVESIAPDKHVNDVRVIGAGYLLIVAVCINHRIVLNNIYIHKINYKENPAC